MVIDIGGSFAPEVVRVTYLYLSQIAINVMTIYVFIQKLYFKGLARQKIVE